MTHALYRWSELELRDCKWWGLLPDPVDDIIPRRCPVCGSPAVPTMGVDGRMAPRWTYACDADYRSMQPGRLRRWQPKAGCALVRGSQVLGWIRELCASREELGAVAEALGDERFTAPFPAVERLPLAVSLPRWRAADRPAVCPACRARAVETGHEQRFACGARYRWSPARKELAPAGECRRPSLDHVLRLVRAKGPPLLRAACDRALVAHQRSVIVVDVFGSS